MENESGRKGADLKLIRIKQRELPADIVVQSVECLCDWNSSECHISNLFGCIFLLCNPSEALEGPILTGVCKI